MSEAEHKPEKENEEIEYVAVEAEALTPVEDEAKPKSKSEDAEDEDLDDDEDDDEDELSSDPRAGHSEEDDDGDDRVRRKRLKRRQRKKEAVERDQRELNFLRQRNEQLERRFSSLEGRVAQSETSALDQRINYLKGQIRTADQVIAQSVKNNNGDDMVEAQSIRDTLKESLRSFEEMRDSLRAEPVAQPDVDPTMLRHATKFAESNPWWDPNGGDEDSLIVSAIDNALARQGLDPRSEGYWTELTKRVKARLPNRFKPESQDDDDDDDESPAADAGKGAGKAGGKRQPRGPTFRVGGRERPLKPNEVFISEDRKQAMIEAGVWDDPKTRQKYLKRYAEYDRDHGVGA